MSNLSEKYLKVSILTMLQQSIIKSPETKNRKSLKKKPNGLRNWKIQKQK